MLTLAGPAAISIAAPAEAAPRPSVALTPGTITIAPATGAALPVETGRVFEEAVQRACYNAGFTLLPGQDHSRYIVKVTVTHTSRGAVVAGRSAASPPLASFGGGVSLSLPAGGPRLGELAVTELTVVLSRRSDGRAVWSGSAVTARVDDSLSGAVDVIARTLADAVLSRFPYQAAGPISIP